MRNISGKSSRRIQFFECVFISSTHLRSSSVGFAALRLEMLTMVSVASLRSTTAIHVYAAPRLVVGRVVHGFNGRGAGCSYRVAEIEP